MPCVIEGQSSRRRFARPIIVVSSCLLGKPVRWDGTRITCEFVQQLSPHAKIISVCPEADIGLGVPRDPIRLVSNGDSIRLVQPFGGRKLTRAMKNFSRQFIESLVEVDGFILKARSPSCGLKSVKLFGAAAGSRVMGRTSGLFAGEIMKRWRGLPIADELTINLERHKHHFLTRLFRIAAFRAVVRLGTVNGLVRFHRENRLLLAAHNQAQLTILDRIVSNPKEIKPDKIFRLYRTHLVLALRRSMRNRAIGVIMHTHRQWLNNQENPSAAKQTLLEPFPLILRDKPTP